MAVDLIVNRQVVPFSVEPTRVIGAFYLDRDTLKIESIRAAQVILASGGAGKSYLYTSNWEGATGDGIAMAWRCGARIANMEFMQFHPTCLYHPQARNFLISEALRGEGGELINQQGEAFMKRYHPLGSLAPRDIVARSIDQEMKRTGSECAYLDMRSLSRDRLIHHFPQIFEKCLSYGIDIATQPIPVVPAAHYLCGGVVTDLNGQTDVQNLWALGETACTGFHGANRLASNSLLECLTMAHNCSNVIGGAKDWAKGQDYSLPQWTHPDQTDADEQIVIHHMWDEIRRLMWNYVGIVRSNKRLDRAAHRLSNIITEFKDYYSNFRMTPDLIELRNIAIVADLTVQSALKRKESRGIHFNLDYPQANDASVGQDVILRVYR
jgi:L-aspartate oxidase